MHIRYHTSWDREPQLIDDEFNDHSFNLLWSDFHLCKWPDNLSNGCFELAEHFARINEPTLSVLAAHLPSAPAEGRPPPTRRLEKTETYALYGQKPHVTGPLWTSILDVERFFTPRSSPRTTQKMPRRLAATGVLSSQVEASLEEAEAETEVAGGGGGPAVGGDGAAGSGSVGRRRPFIISLSHMVPRQELIPEKRMLLQPSLQQTLSKPD